MIFSWVLDAVGGVASGVRWLRGRRYRTRAEISLGWAHLPVSYPGAPRDEWRRIEASVGAGRDFEFIVTGGTVEARRPWRWPWRVLGDLSDMSTRRLPVSVEPNRGATLKIPGPDAAKAIRDRIGEEGELKLRVTMVDHRGGRLRTPALSLTVAELEEERVR